MKNIDNLIFDLGGVILDIDISRTMRAFGELGIKNVEQYFGHGFAASFVKDHEVGKISDEQFISDLKATVNSDLPDGEVITAWNALLLSFLPERIQLLKSLRKKYRLFLFSNTNSIHHRHFHRSFDTSFPSEHFDDHFDKAYYSHVLGLRKPEIESYQAIVQEQGLDPKRTLFIDDALVNIEGAVKSGIQGLYLPPAMTILDIDWFAS